ncbi:MAG: response regulator [Alphaproteobacteria bacterium]|nr:response regulator [Alphaproteobacteria bacterium]
MSQILLVEDDPQLVELVGEFLRSHAYSVEVETRGDTAVSRILALDPELVLLDLMLPGLDGMEVCRQARERGYHGAIVMLTARGDAIDEILGLQVGADDYLAKPVRPRVLLAHVQAVLRRTQPPKRTVQRGRLELDHASRTVRLDGNPVDLTTAEFELLAVMAARAGEILSRDDLSLALRGFEWDGVDRSIDLRVSRLRKKLDDDGAIIKSVRGSGYLLVPEV